VPRIVRRSRQRTAERDRAAVDVRRLGIGAEHVHRVEATDEKASFTSTR
jgi:hypothetical protein